MLVLPALFVPNSTVSGASRMSFESFHALKFLSLSFVNISVVPARRSSSMIS